METSYFLKRLKEDFSRRKRTNTVYSLRAYGRDLGVHPSTLSQILLGNRPLPIKNAKRVMERLNLNGKERTLFVDSLNRSQFALDQIKIPKQEDRMILDEAYFQIIAEWEHYAVLTLFDCDDFVPTPKSISKRLNISMLRADVVITNLITFGLLQKDRDGNLKKIHSRVSTTEDVASQALRASHREALELGKAKLDEIDVEMRDFSSLMTAVDLSKLPEAKAIIREFRLKLLELMRSGSKKTQVYQMAIQFYPVTSNKEK
jgi:uncharacterized protein (TIGR02147 family)